jgi:hypothetical protein
MLQNICLSWTTTTIIVLRAGLYDFFFLNSSWWLAMSMNQNISSLHSKTNVMVVSLHIRFNFIIIGLIHIILILWIVFHVGVYIFKTLLFYYIYYESILSFT